jgi:predicted ATP-binding protein involved in virulence
MALSFEGSGATVVTPPVVMLNDVDMFVNHFWQRRIFLQNISLNLSFFETENSDKKVRKKFQYVI